MAASRQIWCWRRSWEFYILMCRQQKELMCHSGCSLSMYNLKIHLHSKTPPPTRSHLLIVLLPMSQAFKHIISLWRAISTQTPTILDYIKFKNKLTIPISNPEWLTWLQSLDFSDSDSCLNMSISLVLWDFLQGSKSYRLFFVFCFLPWTHLPGHL